MFTLSEIIDQIFGLVVCVCVFLKTLIYSKQKLILFNQTSAVAFQFSDSGARKKWAN